LRTAVIGLFLGLIWLRAGRKTTSGSILEIRNIGGLLIFSWSTIHSAESLEVRAPDG